MTTFVYKARTSQGALLAGEVEGTNAREVKEALAGEGLFPVSVQPKSFHLSLKEILFGRLKPQELFNFTRQFQALFAAGLSVDRIFTTLIQQTSHRYFREIIKKIHHDISTGTSLADAFARHPRTFSKMYTSMIAVGEAGGVLDKTLKELASIVGKEHRIRSRVKTATLYPKIVFVVTTLVAAGMLLFVIPVFADFYAGYGAALPLPTRILIGASKLVTTYWYVGAALFLGIVWSARLLVKTQRGRTEIDRLKLRTPVIGRLLRMVANARFGHLVGALYRAGLPLGLSLEVVAETIDNSLFAQAVLRLRQEIDRGGSLARAMRQDSSFSPLLVESVAAGEESGRLDELLDATATFYDEEVEEILKNLTTLIEPILLFIVFGMVALLALAIFLPIWNLSNVILPPSS